MAEQLDLRSDGTIGLDLCGERYVLRRPTIGEMRKMHEAAEAADDPVDSIRAEQVRAAANGEVATQSVFPVLYAEGAPYVQWLREVVRILADGAELPPTDDLPSWAAMPGVCRDMLMHWRDVPLARGGQRVAEPADR